MPSLQLSPDTIAQASHEIQNQGFAKLPAVLSETEALRVELLTRPMPRRRVFTTNIKYGTYDAQDIESGHFLWETFHRDDLLGLCRDAIEGGQDEPLNFTQSWLHRYKEGEFIAPHKDAAGSIQLIVSLFQPPVENGGVLHIKTKSAEHTMAMQTGDAFLFKASQLVHYSTPLVPTDGMAKPLKVIAVARYFFGEEGAKP